MKERFLFSLIVMSLLFLCSCEDPSTQSSTSSSNASTNESNSSIVMSNSSLDTYNSIEEITIVDTSSLDNDKVYEKFKELSNEEEFVNLTKQEKEEYLTPILNEFIDSGYITEFNFNLDVSPPIVDFKFPNGAIGTYELEDYNSDDN